MNAGHASATSPDIPSMAVREALRRGLLCTATTSSDGTGSVPLARGVRKTAGTTIVCAVTSETGVTSRLSGAESRFVSAA